MTRAVLVLGAVLMLSSGCGTDLEVVTGSGERVTRSYEVAPFTEIDVSDAFRVRVTVEPTAPRSVELEADDNLVDRADIRVDDGRLRIRWEDSLRLRVDEPPTVEIVVEGLDRIEVSGASTLTVDGIVTPEVEVRGSGASTIAVRGDIGGLTGRLDGASTLTLEEIDGGDVTFDVAGASSLTLSGAADSLVLDVGGASRVEARDLATLIADVDANGASTIEVSVSESVEADASGASTIRISGGAEIDSSASDGSTVERG